MAQLTVKFVSELISATRDKAGEVIVGDPKRIKEVTDIWTFAREVATHNPNWRLMAKQAANRGASLLSRESRIRYSFCGQASRTSGSEPCAKSGPAALAGQPLSTRSRPIRRRAPGAMKSTGLTYRADAVCRSARLGRRPSSAAS